MAIVDYSQILDSLPDAVTVQDRDFNIIYQNRAIREVFGGSLVGAKCFTAYEQRARVCEDCGVERVFQTGKPTTVIRTAIDAQGRANYFENVCFPILDAEGNIIAAAEVARNISDRVTLEAEVKDRNVRLGQLTTRLEERMTELQSELARREEAEKRLRQEMDERREIELELRRSQKLRAVGQLAAGLAHQINTPAQYVGDSIRFLAECFRDTRELVAKYREAIATLTAGPGHEELVQELGRAEESADLEYAEKNAPAALARAAEGVSRISSIVRAMKDFSQPDAHEKAPADLNRALQATLTIAHNEYEHVAQVETELGELPLVRCHVSSLNQVFLTLIVNAAHAIMERRSPARGGEHCIRVRTATKGSTVRVEISDTGDGIPEAIRERIFEPFFTTKEIGRSSGQGLAIARAIVVEQHGGTLTFSSESGCGTTFVIELPIDGASRAGAPLGSQVTSPVSEQPDAPA